ncbi:hypothetical protein K438DRAFT_1759136 [Mycena galopus ATCC 62051]|nr:hypothetical protein K438DRAFT_1759136 [Mycena galopus ATCC 62051]
MRQRSKQDSGVWDAGNLWRRWRGGKEGISRDCGSGSQRDAVEGQKRVSHSQNIVYIHSSTTKSTRTSRLPVSFQTTLHYHRNIVWFTDIPQLLFVTIDVCSSLSIGHNAGFADTAASPKRRRDVPKPLTELHAPSRSASSQAARRDYSEHAFSVAAVAPTSSTSFSASSASPMLTSKSTCTLLPPHLTSPEMGSVRSASLAADLLPLDPVGSPLDTLPTEQRSTLPKIDGTRPHQSSTRHRLRSAEIVSRNRTSGRCQLASSFDPVQHASATARPSHQRVRYNDKDPPWRVGAHPDNAARAMHGLHLGVQSSGESVRSLEIDAMGGPRVDPDMLT